MSSYYQQLRADRAVVERAARWLRDQAIADGYLGFEHKHLAFALALILDEIARHFRDLDEQPRAHILESCRMMLGQE